MLGRVNRFPGKGFVDIAPGFDFNEAEGIPVPGNDIYLKGFVPEDALVNIMGEDAWWSVPLSVLLGIPLYSNAAGVIPIVSALLGKGAALGTALAFMMSVVALSLPELIILRRVLKPQLLAILVAVIGVSILLTGYLFNMVM